ncbi:MAG: hypothetical protein AB7O73_03660 [Bacteroidia bacterium]
MKRLNYIVALLLFSAFSYSQLTIVKKGSKYGVNNGETVFLSPIYDTILPINEAKQICVACKKSMLPSKSSFIKMNTTVFRCRYYDKNALPLVLIINKKDTCGYFSMSKKTLENLNSHPDYFSVETNNKKFMVTNDFKQITLTPYDNIYPSKLKGYFVTENKTHGAGFFNGLIDNNELEIVPMKYTGISVNPFDSLVSACTAQLKVNGIDDVYNLKGEKVFSSHRHIELATKEYIIHKLFEPEEYYVIHRISDKKDWEIRATQINYLGKNTVEIIYHGKTFTSNLDSLDELKFIEHEQNKSSH